MNSETDLEKRIERHTAIMQRIAANYAKNSEEEIALRLSTLSYFFVVCRHDDEFQKYLSNLDKPLSESEKAFLIKIGVGNPEK